MGFIEIDKEDFERIYKGDLRSVSTPFQTTWFQGETGERFFFIRYEDNTAHFFVRT